MDEAEVKHISLDHYNKLMSDLDDLATKLIGRVGFIEVIEIQQNLRQWGFNSEIDPDDLPF